MKIAIIGIGAMGSVYAGLLADSGNEIWAIDLWKEHVDAIASQAYVLKEQVETERSKVSALQWMVLPWGHVTW